MSPDHIAILAGLIIAFCIGWGLACGALAWSYKRAVRRDSEAANRRDATRFTVYVNGALKVDTTLDELARQVQYAGKAVKQTFTGQVSLSVKRADA